MTTFRSEAPGEFVTAEPRYLDHDEKRRQYWETGANAALGPEERLKLSELAGIAARYVPEQRTSGAHLPAAGRDWDHGMLIRAVATYIQHRMPRGDIPGKPAPRRSLSWLLRSGALEREGVRPSDTPSSEREPGWVCINAATALGGLLRALGYPVRECNVYLGQGGSAMEGHRGATYQEAALQVWFDGRWHWVDAYLGIFDPAFTRDDGSLYKRDELYYWDRLEPPEGWIPDEPTQGWRRFEHPADVGTALHRRFFPKCQELEESIVEICGCTPRVRHCATNVERCGTATSGVWLRAWGRQPTLRLIDARGRVCDARRTEIPGANHISAGAPVTFPRFVACPGHPNSPFWRGPEGLCHPESIFFGTTSLLAEWDEVGSSTLTLIIRASRNQTIDIEVEIVPAHHSVTVTGLPASVEMLDEDLMLSFTVTVAPVDARFHAKFTRLLRQELTSQSAYWAAADDFLARKQHDTVPARFSN